MKNERLFSLQVIFAFILSVAGFMTAGALYLIGCLAFGYATMRISGASLDKKEIRQTRLEFANSAWSATIIASFPSAIFDHPSGYLNKWEWLLISAIVCWSIGLLLGFAKNRKEKRLAMATTPKNLPLVA